MAEMMVGQKAAKMVVRMVAWKAVCLVDWWVVPKVERMVERMVVK